MSSAHRILRRPPAGAGTMAQQGLMFTPEYPSVAEAPERKGVVYTKEWVVELVLDLAGYTEERNLVDARAVEPSAGEGAFLSAMARRLIGSCRRQGRALADCRESIIAFELDGRSAAQAVEVVAGTLKAAGVEECEALALARGWVRTGDYLFAAFRLGAADFVIGNPPYVRLEEIPEQVAGSYRGCYPTMTGRADLYVAFHEAGLRQLAEGGVCAFICADRWMLNQYGGALRKFVTDSFGVETIVEMHEANAFHDDVSAYPAITVIRRGAQRTVVVARAGAAAEGESGKRLAAALERVRGGGKVQTPGLTVTAVRTWFTGSDPWPCSSPKRISLLRRIEERFGPLETEDGATKVGIGVATGLDEVFITTDPNLVEESRLLKLALARDTLTGAMKWSGHYLVDPWREDGLVELAEFPRLRAYFEEHGAVLKRRHTAKKSAAGWYRTIDRVTHALAKRPKLYVPDIKDEFNPVLDRGETYPHHNLYYVQSEAWDLEVLGGILLSSAAQLFIESYGVRMRGGYLRFQAQYLRRIRVPDPRGIAESQAELFRRAFRERDRNLASRVACEIYGVEPAEMEDRLEP